MKTQNIEIFEHDTDIDVTHKINTIELENWISHLKYIKKELTNLIGLCNAEISANPADNKVLLGLQKKETENETLLNVLSKYAISRSDIIECEDTHCDMAYVKEHEAYRRSYLYHLDTYRQLKDDFFRKAHGKFALLNNETNN
jgi:hypothetical protein